MKFLSRQLKTLPSAPGIYLFKDKADRILYVGKAKVLKNRVRSYFRPGANLEPAKKKMIPQISDIETITTDTEVEALILEANLIRRHQPPYNVVLRDDKYYLFIKITANEDYPRVFPVRRVKSDGARYFGPYSSAAAVRQTLRLLRRIFPHKGEKESPRERIFPHPLFSLSENSTPHTLHEERNDWRTLAPKLPLRSAKDRGFGKRTEYGANIANVIRFLKGEREEIIATLQTGMKAAAQEKHYEQAAILRDQLHAIKRLEGGQKVYLPRQESFDVISQARNNTRSAVNVFAVRGGKLLNKNTFLLAHRAAAQPQDTVRQFLLQYYSVAQDIPPAILIPEPLIDQDSLAIWINRSRPPRLIVPRRGRKKQLLALGETNARQLLKQEQADFAAAAAAGEAARRLATALQLPGPLTRIETYDISNTQGHLATGSMVVFTRGLPDKNQYRKFRIRTTAMPNDFAMLQEVLRRRFAGNHPAWKLPNLLVIDGGKGQLSAAVKILQELNVTVPVTALAKREEELFVPGRGQALRLPYDDPALYLLQRMRDEAHRFTLTYHRLLRRKQATQSILDEIPGIGPAAKKKLLARFGSLKAIRAASAAELSSAIGPAKTRRLRDYL
ncbi:MAG: excinuclease ABC subunit C [Candidatus Andersenbacteria bacterium CG10_big_fil_rev_8_21_14_0_10_54_11]|uniref:UvrABC system protein C n=1 Tax=Candidatus Andersenbacteria bacterium CG10_big_fil_rev_8_21_14_0_10_54_11 TaxID=1974485 RepID=A0A2M6WYN1_9BACT|nr:MAG: excinuclease ABC subunit C [Candidatus Andersenbacteria bacterium CG10_big_fil_rev_8_21_14_0_10_54_11]